MYHKVVIWYPGVSTKSHMLTKVTCLEQPQSQIGFWTSNIGSVVGKKNIILDIRFILENLHFIGEWFIISMCWGN